MGHFQGLFIFVWRQIHQSKIPPVTSWQLTNRRVRVLHDITFRKTPYYFCRLPVTSNVESYGKCGRCFRFWSSEIRIQPVKRRSEKSRRGISQWKGRIFFFVLQRDQANHFALRLLRLCSRRVNTSGSRERRKTNKYILPLPCGGPSRVFDEKPSRRFEKSRYNSSNYRPQSTAA